MDVRNVGTFVMVAGTLVTIVGFLLARGWLSWFGRLPGDIRIVSDTARVYVPITSMLLVSLVLTVAANLVRRLW